MTTRSSDHAAAPVSTFAQALEAAAGTAALSPSSHNCQPWGLARATTTAARRAAADLTGQDADEYLVLALDRERELTALAAHAVEMEVSCGIYWRILLRALAAQGWTAAAVRTLDGDGLTGSGDETGSGGGSGSASSSRGASGAVGGALLGAGWPAAWTPLCVVALRPGTPSAERLDDLRETALARRTHRGPYRPAPVSAELLRDLAKTASPEGGKDAVRLRHLTERRDLRAFAAFVARHAGLDFAHRAAWRETHSFLRRDLADAAARGDGFTLEQLFGPMSRPRRAAMRRALAPATMHLLGKVGYHRVLAAGLADIVRRTPAVVTMGFAERAPARAELLRGGARLADYWWRATRHGLSLHPVSIVIQHEDLRVRLERELSLPGGRTFFVSRIGVAGRPAPHSHRRDDAAGHVAI
ncbi:RedV protein [Streptomyces sp. R1]|uniref:RedV protein n=1 Tax=unclassified Streptomyces TaxID=2593676 RepID=UPI001E3B3271|nr:RedV protein [Streptomyces sp. R1]MCC8339065.1 RedV protein [Streptomyces sp. R1]MDA4890519.1 RedV protein [Streptomyces sp. MS2A]